MKICRHRFSSVLCCAAVVLTGSPPARGLPVFPGASGFGAHTVAGRGGQVYRVINLNDRGPGSLRHGIEQIEGPRVIVFEVSGVIALESDLVVRPKSEGEFGFLTIAGQTAPPPGITLKNAGIAVRSHDVLIQHLAIRPGAATTSPRLPRLLNRDAIKIEAPPGQTAYNIVIDHVSCSWATDETVSTWSDQGSIYHVSFLNSIFSESIRRADPEKATGYGGLGGRNTIGVSFVGNLFALNQSRNPLIRDAVLNAEIVNNFIYRPHHSHMAAIYFGSAHPGHPDLSLIASAAGNVIVRAPSGTWEGRDYRVSSVGVFVHDRAPTGMSLYLANNRVLDPDTGVWHPTDGKAFSPEIYRTGAFVPKTWTSNPFPYTHSAPSMDEPQVIEKRVVTRAGKHPALRDPIDAALIGKIERRTGSWVLHMDDLGPDPWSPADERHTRPLELPPEPNGDADNDGYTNLEEWLHDWAAYVEGRADEPPGAGAVDPARATDHQVTGVVDGLPVFFQKAKDRVTHPLSWTSGNYDDFEAWKQRARERVRAAWLNPPPKAPWNVAILGEEDRGSYVARKFVFNITGDSRVLAYLTVPKGEGPFPAVLLLHDHGGHYLIGKEKVVRPFGASEEMTKDAEVWIRRGLGGRYLADELSQRGYVCFATDAINWGDRAGGEFAGQQALASNLMHLGMSFAGVTAWEDLRAAEFLAEQPEVDARRIAAMGLSMGAYRTWQVAAMSDNIAAGVVVCWMGTMKSMIVPGQNQTRGASAYSMLHPGLLADLDYPDIASLAAPKPMLFYSGRYDRLFPQGGVDEAFAKLRAVWDSQGAGDQLVTRTWDVEHKFNVEMQEAAFAWLDRVMKVEGVSER